VFAGERTGPRKLCCVTIQTYRQTSAKNEGPACLLLVENREDNLIYGAGSFWADRCYTEQRDKRRKLSSHGGAGDIS